MNRLSGHISAIEVCGSMSLVTIDISSTIHLKTIIIETPETASYLLAGNPVQAVFKETEVIIGTDETHNISLQNRLPGQIITIESGKLISKIAISTEAGIIVSIISTNAVNSLNLQKDLRVIAMIKLNEIMLSA
ncbi:MAG: molybdate transport system regulatory protein [Saprospiraceae bacterium]|jgi:molybdate transport system regulatory protein